MFLGAGEGGSAASVGVGGRECGDVGWDAACAGGAESLLLPLRGGLALLGGRGGGWLGLPLCGGLEQECEHLVWGELLGGRAGELDACASLQVLEFADGVLELASVLFVLGAVVVGGVGVIVAHGLLVADEGAVGELSEGFDLVAQGDELLLEDGVSGGVGGVFAGGGELVALGDVGGFGEQELGLGFDSADVGEGMFGACLGEFGLGFGERDSAGGELFGDGGLQGGECGWEFADLGVVVGEVEVVLSVLGGELGVIGGGEQLSQDGLLDGGGVASFGEFAFGGDVEFFELELESLFIGGEGLFEGVFLFLEPCPHVLAVVFEGGALLGFVASLGELFAELPLAERVFVVLLGLVVVLGVLLGEGLLGEGLGLEGRGEQGWGGASAACGEEESEQRPCPWGDGGRFWGCGWGEGWRGGGRGRGRQDELRYEGRGRCGGGCRGWGDFFDGGGGCGDAFGREDGVGFLPADFGLLGEPCEHACWDHALPCLPCSMMDASALAKSCGSMPVQLLPICP